MNADLGVREVAELDFVLEPGGWDFADARRDAIAAHWERLRQAKPAMYNGRVLLMKRREIVRRADGGLRLAGAYFETDYASFVAWRDFPAPGDPTANCFSMAALRCADGAFLLGEMASHTVNGGRIYFPAGTPDPSDVIGGKVDLDASARRELLEETRISADETAVAPGWAVVDAGRLIACMKPMALPLQADEAKARIEAFLARDPKAELARMHIVRDAGDLDPERTPGFVLAYIRSVLG